MAKKNGSFDERDLSAAVRKIIERCGGDAEKIAKMTAAMQVAEHELTLLEKQHREKLDETRQVRKKVDAARENWRKITQFGPDPQEEFPFVEDESDEGGPSLAGLDPDSATAAASYNKKKAKAVEATKKRGAKKKAGRRSNA